MPGAATEVVEYAAKLLGVGPPPLVNFEDADLSPMGRSFYSASKKMKNNKIKQKLGVELKYPTYREGLDAIFTKYK
jgi:nucleoside-diphosphate-sugar epimerase